MGETTRDPADGGWGCARAGRDRDDAGLLGRRTHPKKADAL